MVVVEANGLVSFRVYRPGVAAVEIRGAFTGWADRPIRMRPEGNGWWTARSAVPPGDHLFSYVVDGDSWFPDYAAHGIKANGFGGWVSQLHVAADLTARAA